MKNASLKKDCGLKKYDKFNNKILYTSLGFPIVISF